MAIFTAIGTAIAGALFAGSTLAASIIAGGLALGTQLLLGYLNRPKKRSYTAVQGEIQYGGDVPVSTAFGICATHGHRIFYAKYGSGNKYNAEVFVLANGWCDGLEPEIYFYGERYTLESKAVIGNEVAHYGVQGFNDLISIRFYDGRPGQLADQKLVSDTSSLGRNWKSTSVCAGMAYVVVEREWNADKFSKGRPDFKFVLRGLREYDPRLDSTVAGGSGSQRVDDPSTWVHTMNPAVHRLNYQLGLKGLISGRTLIGEGKTLGQLELGSYFAAMNVCDTLRGSRATYECSLIVNAQDDHTEVLKEFDDAMAGYGMNRGGLSGVIAGAPQTPVLSITEDDIPADRPRSVQLRKSSFDLYNHISGQYTSPESNWEPESLTPVTVNADVAKDGRVRQTGNDFLQVTDPDTAQYLLQIRYRQNRHGGSATLPVSRRAGLAVNEGEWVTYRERTWLVTSRVIDSEFLFTLELAETSADVYSEDGIEPGPVVVPPPVPVNPSLLSTVQNFDVAAGSVANDAGHVIPALTFTWTPPQDPSITQVRIFYKVDDGDGGDSAETLFGVTSADPESGSLVTSVGVVGGETYVARATISTQPDRFKTFTQWETTATETDRARIITELEDIGDSLRDRFVALQNEFNDLQVQLQTLAQAVAEGAGVVVDENSVAVRYREATAAVLQQMSASIDVRTTVFRQPTEPTANADGDIWIDTDDNNFVRVWNGDLDQWEDAASTGVKTYSQDDQPAEGADGDLWIDTNDDNKLYRYSEEVSPAGWVEVADERIAAVASALTALDATMGDLSSGGLWRMTAEAGVGDVVARVVLQVRATVSDDWITAGTVWEAGFVNSDPLQPFSRMVNSADQFIVTDGSNEAKPLVYSGNTLKLTDIVLATLKFDQLESNNGKLILKGSGTDASLEIFN